MHDKQVVLGHINGLFGVQGWVKVFSYTRPPENLLGYERWFLGHDETGRQPDWRSFSIVAARPQGKTLIAQLADAQGEVIADRDAAVALLDMEIAVARADMPTLPPDEYYWHDLVGFEVINREAVSLGHVGGMMETGAADVLVVEGDCQRLIPFVIGVIVDDVDLAVGRISVDWQPDF